ncbi:unnamed protein product [Protopolystoma xenopodis]|uniref:Uncharacterized protein n=1 Tax=Protopolystoma xenopodis TaxID=117903 RepID=A0A448WQN6_9PLAT|nr:unnamed protein product [Protopolystoma xenopodis]
MGNSIGMTNMTNGLTPAVNTSNAASAIASTAVSGVSCAASSGMFPRDPTTSTPIEHSASAMSARSGGAFSSHGGAWHLVHRITGHRDGIWEVTSFRRIVATASADSTVRLWMNQAVMK